MKHRHMANKKRNNFHNTHFKFDIIIECFYLQLPPRHAKQDRKPTCDKQEISFQGFFRQNGKQTQLLLWTPQDQGLQVMMTMTSKANLMLIIMTIIDYHDQWSPWL